MHTLPMGLSVTATERAAKEPLAANSSFIKVRVIRSEHTNGRLFCQRERAFITKLMAVLIRISGSVPIVM